MTSWRGSLRRPAHAVGRGLADHAAVAQHAARDRAGRQPVGLRSVALDGDLLVQRIGQQPLLADREGRQARIADIGDHARLVALVDRQDAGRQAGVAVIGEPHRRHRIARRRVGAVERQPLRRHLAIDHRQGKRAAVDDAHRAGELERHLRRRIRGLDLLGAARLCGRRGRGFVLRLSRDFIEGADAGAGGGGGAARRTSLAATPPRSI